MLLTTMKAIKNCQSNVALGSFCVLMGTITVVGSNYAVKLLKASPGDVTLLKATVQVLFFGAFVLVLKRCKGTPVGGEQVQGKSLSFLVENKEERKYLAMIFCCAGFIPLLLYYSIKWVPMSEVTVIISASPMMSYMNSRLILKTPISHFKTFLCLMIITGVGLIVQPQFVVLSDESEAASESDNAVKYSAKYWTGILLAVVYTFLSSASIVFVKMIKSTSINVIMFWTGMGSFVGPLICYSLGMKVELFTGFPPDNDLEWNRFAFHVALGAAAVFLASIVFLGCVLGTPAIVVAAILRLDLLMVLVVEMAYFRRFPNLLASVGYVTVLLSVLGTLTADVVEKFVSEKMTAKFKTKKKGEEEMEEATGLNPSPGSLRKCHERLGCC